MKTEQRRRRKAMRRKVSLVIAGQKTESCFQQKQTSNLIASEVNLTQGILFTVLNKYSNSIY
ncbi:hypothetical protein, partial [Listeria innocua]|uniref:hypothetical protein n=1 Tax=Listeria innocua TaxID=1642 RepID=UPI002270EDA2